MSRHEWYPAQMCEARYTQYQSFALVSFNSGFLRFRDKYFCSSRKLNNIHNPRFYILEMTDISAHYMPKTREYVPNKNVTQTQSTLTSMPGSVFHGDEINPCNGRRLASGLHFISFLACLTSIFFSLHCVKNSLLHCYNIYFYAHLNYIPSCKLNILIRDRRKFSSIHRVVSVRHCTIKNENLISARCMLQITNIGAGG
jgi:hypothetical protein